MAEPDDELPEDRDFAAGDGESEEQAEPEVDGHGDNDEQPDGPRTDFNSFLTGIDFSAFTAGIDFSAFAPTINLSALVPKVDIGPMYDAAVFMAGIDTSSLVPKIDFSAFTAGIDFSKLLAGLDLSHFSDSYPPNWPLDVDLDQVTEVISGDGIPLVWVPRQTIVEEVLAAPDRASRIGILLAHSEALVVDCGAVLDAITEPSLQGQLPLARNALAAYAHGHQEAAQALATVVTETAVAAALSSRYEEVKDAVVFDPDKTSWTRLRLRAALAPIHRFYTTWYRSSGAPAPEALSRHVTVHEADATHYTAANALVAVLLVTSVLRAIQELQAVAAARKDEDGQAEEEA